MRKTESISGRVKRTVIQSLELQLSEADIADDEVLFGGGMGLDSIGVLQIVFGLESEFGIEVTDDELRVELFDSVATLTEYVEGKLQRGTRASAEAGASVLDES